MMKTAGPQTMRVKPADLPAPPRVVRRRYVNLQVVAARYVLTPAVIVTLGVVSAMVWVSVFGERYQGRITNIRQQKLPNDAVASFAQYSFEVNGKTFNGEQRIFDFNTMIAPNSAAIVRSVDVLGYRYSTLADGWGDFVNQYATMLMLVSVFAFVAAWVVLFRGWIIPGRQKKLARNGVVAGAVITQLPPGPQFRCRYSFTDASGTEREGTYRIPATRALRLNVGDPLTILCDPARPARHIVYEFCDYTILERGGTAP